MGRTLHLEEIPYRNDSCDLFEAIRELPYPALLDSCHASSGAGRYDILVAQPDDDGLPVLAPGAGEAGGRRFFDDLARFHAQRYRGIQPASPHLPFCGGLLGRLDYGLGHRLNSVRVAEGTAQAGDVALHAYDWCVVQDHLLRRAVLVAQPQVSAGTRRELLSRLQRPPPEPGPGFRLSQPFSSNLSPAAYRRAFEQVQRYILAGDCYQVNLARRFSATFEGDPWRAYRLLRGVAGGPFSAFLAEPDSGAVLCLSPERFLSLTDHHVETSPIKGTRPRHADPAADRAAAEELRHSPKDRAENLMIVDLLRNDLGRSCVPGTIHVDRLFELQSFATVHHLVSTISGELRAGKNAFDLLCNSFPGGSITGAPKRRAMEIIAELEPDPRGAYCGSVLYLSADGRLDSNIAIRTLRCEAGRIHCWGGGGIVADSSWEREYQEIADKIGPFLRALESLGSP